MLRPRLISKLFYGLLLASLRQQSSSPTSLKAILFQKRSGYRRTVSVVQFVDDLIPWFKFTDLSSQWISKNNRFPWVSVETELIASGTGAAVFRVSWRGAEKVLRIYRRSLGKPLGGLLQVAAYYKSNYEMLLSWYGSSAGLVLPMDFLVLQGPSLVGPVTASLQPYIHGQKYDLFEDFSDNELLALLAKNDPLRQQFLCFAGQTLLQWHDHKMCFDFLGRDNIMLVDQSGKYSLCISDCGIFKFDDLNSKYVRIKPRFEQRIDRLAFLYKKAKASSPGAHTSPVPARH